MNVVTTAAVSRYISFAPPPTFGTSVNFIFMPSAPASPRKSAYSDQSQAARTPRETSVSIVAVPCLRFVQAARWNGHAAHRTTGVASCNASHCQWSNCSAGIIETSSTGSESSAEAIRRRRGGGGQSRCVAGGFDRVEELLGRDAAGVVGDARLLGRVVDASGDAVKLVQLALDPARARGAGHAADRQLDLRKGGAHR